MWKLISFGWGYFRSMCSFVSRTASNVYNFPIILIEYGWFSFACTGLYAPLCQFVGPSVGRPVGLSVRQFDRFAITVAGWSRSTGFRIRPCFFFLTPQFPYQIRGQPQKSVSETKALKEVVFLLENIVFFLANYALVFLGGKNFKFDFKSFWLHWNSEWSAKWVIFKNWEDLMSNMAKFYNEKYCF